MVCVLQCFTIRGVSTPIIFNASTEKEADEWKIKIKSTLEFLKQIANKHSQMHGRRVDR